VRKRIFIAINLPDNIKKQLAEYQEKWAEIPANWTKPKNIHITLSFIGYAFDNEIYEISKIVKQVAKTHEPFDVKLNKICYGPLQKSAYAESQGKLPRMIWAIGDKSKEFSGLRQDLENALAETKNVPFSPGKKELAPHIALARIRQWEWRKIESEERPEINENISFSFEANSIEIMESSLKRGGADYNIFESYLLGLGK